MADPMKPAPPQPETDAEHLDRSDPTFAAWRTPRPDLQAGREPGLIHLNRYPLSLAPAGIATFLQRPAALTPADLRAAEVDIAMRRKGLTDPHYLAPETVDHGQD